MLIDTASIANNTVLCMKNGWNHAYYLAHGFVELCTEGECVLLAPPQGWVLTQREVA